MNVSPDAEMPVTLITPGRRQRKKQLTRDALLHAAIGLFEAKGYDHTAVHEITDAVDVSERTFFRYFASKEDLMLSFVRDRMSAFAAALAARPPQEDPLSAARNAFPAAHGQPEGAAGAGPAYLRLVKLIEESPALLAAQLRDVHSRDDEIVRVLAQRERVDPATDRRPRLLAAMIGMLVFLAQRECQAAADEAPGAVAAAFDAYAAELVPAVTGHWS